MNTQLSNVVRFLLGAALVVAMMPGFARAGYPTPTPTPSPTPTPTPRYELGIVSGKASKVAAVPTPGPGESGGSLVKITGSFVHAGPTHLPSRQVTLRHLLDETAGAGELIEELQGGSTITLNFDRGNDDGAIFTTPDRSRPNARLSLRRKPGGLYLVSLTLNRADIPSDPTECDGSPPTTTLGTEFVIEDVPLPVLPGPPMPTPTPVHAAITVAGSAAWKCVLDEDKLRVPTGSGGGGGVVNAAPKASVRTELLTRDTGEPSLVLLDGANSSDTDGTIVSYAFSVETTRGVPVFALPAGAASTVSTVLAPGDYTAILVVTDDQGAVSAPGTRGFSIK